MRSFPFRYHIFTVIVIIESILYLKGWNDAVFFPLDWKQENDKLIVIDAGLNSIAYKLGFRNGDQLLSFNNNTYQYKLIWDTFDKFYPGDVIDVKFIRDNKTLAIPVKVKSKLIEDTSFYIFYYMLILLVISIGIFVLYKKPEDKSAKIFFIFSQIFALCLNSTVFIGNSPYGIIRNAVFYFTFPFLGAILIHFFLLFPNKNNLINKIPNLHKYFYAVSFAFALAGFLSNLFFLHVVDEQSINNNLLILELSILWMSICLLISMIIGIYNFFQSKGTVIHNQYRWIMFGILFGLLPETLFGFFQDYFQNFDFVFPHLMTYIWATGCLLLIFFLSLAILKYKLWDIELVIKKSLQYSFLTIVIVGSYLFLASISEHYLNTQSGISNLLAIIISAFLFIPAREYIQKKVDKIFHRETYNATEAALFFESSLINHYIDNDIYSLIGEQLNSIFHFSEFIFLQKREGSYYNVVYSKGDLNAHCFDLSNIESLNNDLFIHVSSIDNLPNELNKMEFFFPVKKENETTGYFICSEKKSQRPYSMQDIELLKLLANRSSTIIQLSTLYKLEIERRELVEKERTRISKDMHDEVGSGLTQIAVLSELVNKEIDNKQKTRENINKISRISREIIDNISEIVWAVNPKNDYLDDLAAYLHEYSVELFDSAGINYKLDFNENIISLPLSAELRRNIFLAIKEIFNNVIKHSDANNVCFNFHLVGNKIKVLISDDGNGFNVNEQHHRGNGLFNIRKRIEDAGGVPEIYSEIGRGTSIGFFLDIK